MQLDIRTRELIAIGASVTAGCHPCLKYHTAKATENGVAQEEIVEAIEVGKMVRKGAAFKMNELIARLTDSTSTASTAEATCSG
jgi:AhpD family alkylhydroperoxidase